VEGEDVARAVHSKPSTFFELTIVEFPYRLSLSLYQHSMEVLTKERLEQLYKTTLNKDLCAMLDITNPTLIALLRKYGIESKGKGNRLSKSKVKLKNK
jgi:hypothetical protein